MFSVTLHAQALVDAAGRQGPQDRVESYGGCKPPMSKKYIHGYTGWVPGRVGESVIGERQTERSLKS